jgi:hypothetical protein
LRRALAEAGEIGLGGGGFVLPDNHTWVHFMRAAQQGEDEPVHQQAKLGDHLWRRLSGLTP